jgi:hypothetical protein
VAKGDIVIPVQPGTKAARAVAVRAAGAALPSRSGDLDMTDAEFQAFAAANEAEQEYIDSLPIDYALDYLAKHPSSAVGCAVLLYFDRRKLRSLRGALESLLDSIAVEEPEGGRIFQLLSTALDDPIV